jgi:hypothetical protein
MSKDKGSKSIKKAPADKSLGKAKQTSDYKSESKGGQVTTAPSAPKLDPKTSKGDKAK